MSYSLGAFSKEPIAGITPIAEMIDAATLDTPRPPIGTRARLEMPVTRDSVAAAMRASMSWARPFADRPGDVQVFGDGVSGQVATMLRPIATPLNLGGFSPDVADMLGASFRDYGFMPVAGGGRRADAWQPSDTPLRPGSAVGVNIVSGDFNMGATGTVTEVIGNRVYAFGHPFFNLGPIAFPMTKAYIHALLPSMTSSMKISTLGDVIGTVHQDRATTIAGLTGDGAGHDSGEDLARIRPRVQEAVRVQSGERSAVHAAVHLRVYSEHADVVRARDGRGHVQHQGHDEREVARGDQDRRSVLGQHARRLSTAGSVMAPLTFLLGNDFEPIQIEAVDLTIQSTEQPRTATIERVWLDGVRAARRPHGSAQGADAHLSR